MKRFILGILFLFICSSCYAGLVTFDAAATDNDISRAWLNNTYYKIYNVVDGGLDTNNFATGAVNSKDITISVNPLKRDDENIGEYVYSGLTIATSVNLTSTITAGIAYVENDSEKLLYRVVTNDTSKTFTASKDTWVYLSYTGAFYYNEQALGAAQPATPDNYMLVAKVTTSAVAITTVTDYCQRTPTNLRIYTDYKNGCVLSRDITTASIVKIQKGEIELGTTGKKRINTSSTNVNFAITGEGGLDAGALAGETYYYVFAMPSSSNATNFTGIASLSSTDAAGVTGERLIGWAYSSSASAISPDSLGTWRGTGGDSPNIVKRMYSNQTTTVSTTYTDLMNAKFICSGIRPVQISYNVASSSDTTDKVVGAVVSVDGIGYWESESYGKTNSASTTPAIELSKSILLNLGEGPHDVSVRWRIESNTGYAWGRTLLIEEK